MNSIKFTKAKKIELILLIAVLLSILSYLFLDRELAFIFSVTRRHSFWFPLFQGMQYIAGDTLAYIISAISIYLVIMLAIGKYNTRFNKFLFCFSVSDCVAIFVGNRLKIIFGRYWPETFLNNNLSFIKDGAYGFTFFNIHREYQSFPSTHSAAIFAIVTIVWIYYPKLRVLSIAICAIVVIGLLGCNYHFLSDIIMGACLGLISAILVNSYISNKTDTMENS